MLEKEYGKDWAPSESVSGHAFRAGQYFQTLSHAKNGGREFMYRIDKVETGPYGRMLGACHAVELAYLFGNVETYVANTYDDLEAYRVAAALLKTLPQNFRDGRFPDFRNRKRIYAIIGIRKREQTL